jgi:hypothetical protein
VPSFRVTYRLVVEADDERGAMKEAARMAMRDDLGRGDRATVRVERIPDHDGPATFRAEGVRRPGSRTG